MHSYSISEQGIKAVKDYIDIERQGDANHNSHALFLPAASISNSTGRLTPIVINQIWNEICTSAGISGKSPHSARHAMGRHIISKSGNIEAVQKQLGHRNAAYSIQYSRITNAELNKIINDRN
jgi:site-specific recombinase XerD